MAARPIWRAIGWYCWATLRTLCLDGLIANATGIVLPLREGGGSNLKTAEALYSGLPLVATTVAMRGYETFRNMDGVIVADDAAAFAAGMRQVFEGRLGTAYSRTRPRRPALGKYARPDGQTGG